MCADMSCEEVMKSYGYRGSSERHAIPEYVYCIWSDYPVTLYNRYNSNSV